MDPELLLANLDRDYDLYQKEIREIQSETDDLYYRGFLDMVKKDKTSLQKVFQFGIDNGFGTYADLADYLLAVSDWHENLK